MDGEIIFDIIELVLDLAIAFSRKNDKSEYRSSSERWSSNINNSYSAVNNDEYDFRMRPEKYKAPKQKTIHSPSPILRYGDGTSPTSSITKPVSKPEPTPKPKPIMKTESIATGYDTITQRIEVEVYMLVYLLQQDDGMISRDEARLIRRKLRPYNRSLSEQQYKELKQLAKEELSVDVLIEKIKKYKIKENEIKRMLKEMDEINRVTKRHGRIITFMRNHMFSELDMMI